MMLRVLRSLWRLLALLAHVLTGIVSTAIYSGLLRLPHNAPAYQKMSSWWLGRIIRILGGRVVTKGEPARHKTLMVCNHIAWLDIPLLGGQSPLRFLSKSEVRQWPVIGWLAGQAGTLYIERGQRGAAQAASDRITASLVQGDVVMVFPEGTTSDGHHVLPFHARLFGSALAADAMVQPVAIRYFDSRGEVSQQAAYVGDMSLIDNLFGLLGEPFMTIEIHYQPALISHNYTRRELAKLSELQVRKALLTD